MLIFKKYKVRVVLVFIILSSVIISCSNISNTDSDLPKINSPFTILSNPQDSTGIGKYIFESISVRSEKIETLFVKNTGDINIERFTYKISPNPSFEDTRTEPNTSVDADIKLCSKNKSLDIGKLCKINIRFKPMSTGDVETELELTYKTYTFDEFKISGRGLNSKILDIEPKFIQLGYIADNQTKNRTLILENNPDGGGFNLKIAFSLETKNSTSEGTDIKISIDAENASPECQLKSKGQIYTGEVTSGKQCEIPFNIKVTNPSSNTDGKEINVTDLIKFIQDNGTANIKILGKIYKNTFLTILNITPTKRYDASFITKNVDDTLYLIGGKNPIDNILSSDNFWTLQYNLWQANTTLKNGNNDLPIANANAEVIDDTIYLFNNSPNPAELNIYKQIDNHSFEEQTITYDSTTETDKNNIAKIYDFATATGTSLIGGANSILIIGGRYNITDKPLVSTENNLLSYNTNTREIARVATTNTPAPRTNPLFINMANSIYLIGGSVDAGLTSDFYRLNDNKAWDNLTKEDNFSYTIPKDFGGAGLPPEDKTLIYSHQTNADILQPLDNSTAVSIGNTIYIFGGDNGTSKTNDLYKYELEETFLCHSNYTSLVPCEVNTTTNLPNSKKIALGTWKLLTPTNDLSNTPYTPSARSNHSMEAIGTEIYIYGGIDNDGDILDDLWSYDTVFNRWQLVRDSSSSQPPATFTNHIVTGYKDIAYILGGTPTDGRTTYEELYTYDLPQQKYNTIILSDNITRPPDDRAVSSTFTTVGDNMYLLGGEPTDTMYKYSVKDNKWSALTATGTGLLERSNAAATVDNVTIYMFGGKTEGTTATNDLIKFNTTNDNDKAETITVDGTKPPARTNTAIAVLDGYIYMTGGKDATGGNLSDTWRYSIAKNTWEDITATLTVNPPAHSDHSLVVFNNKLYLLFSLPATDGQVYRLDDTQWTDITDDINGGTQLDFKSLKTYFTIVDNTIFSIVDDTTTILLP